MMQLGISLTLKHATGAGGGAPAPSLLADVLARSPAIVMDFADTSTLFTDTAGTTAVTTNADIIARANGLSGNGETYQQSSVAARGSWLADPGALVLDGIDDTMTCDVDISGITDGTVVVAYKHRAQGELFAEDPYAGGASNGFILRTIGFNIHTQRTGSNFLLYVDGAIVGTGSPGQNAQAPDLWAIVDDVEWHILTMTNVDFTEWDSGSFSIGARSTGNAPEGDLHRWCLFTESSTASRAAGEAYCNELLNVTMA